MSTPVRALILHDSLETAGLLLRELERGGFSPVFERVHSSETFERALSESAWDVILSDFRLEGFGALPALAILKQRELDTPFIIVSDNIGEETAVKAIKAGRTTASRQERSGGSPRPWSGSCARRRSAGNGGRPGRRCAKARAGSALSSKRLRTRS